MNRPERPTPEVMHAVAVHELMLELGEETCDDMIVRAWCSRSVSALTEREALVGMVQTLAADRKRIIEHSKQLAALQPAPIVYKVPL